ncbi:hypothetical protein CWI42_080370 [Ordospora colligata]|uniref:Uncharacterized protein n=1 Tax=Ordospora colligata OC4 TaxID=1354746 RepID=A0A0B2UJ08_9MICR|nr:uncharacterized protein M896_080370 [Ordospora colligata OC4]KHN69303.1 hypothetical protein M896_080370 [Ordospora colligata OC4]TBU15119.1 hypothetical protein CWI41_080380 [Ordospora colligata]TBU15170.1 hypothetical protein CWI40_080380 [Ordospora colligata]TBU18416.1 hypothetical protein CWI42_080370 [Ordospora colligata]
MRIKFVAEESIRIEEMAQEMKESWVATVVEDRHVLILSPEEEDVLGHEGISINAYYSAKKDFFKNGKSGLDMALDRLNIGDKQRSIITGLVLKIESS